jgi:two-component sensor histidine kinase
LLWFVVDETIEHANFRRGQREGWGCVCGETVEHRHPEDPPTQDAKKRDQIGQTLGGPELRLLSFAARFEELATNSAKYGSLSAADGRVEIAWSRTTDGRLSLSWIESGGPPVTPPVHRGFGTHVMENMIAGQFRGEVRFDWRNQGLACEIALPLAEIATPLA